jgi:hypothetical protein
MKQVLLLCWLFGVQVLTAQTFTIRGQVVDANNAPLAGASVGLQHPWGETFKTAVSDDNGRFAIANVGKGGYKIQVGMLGFENTLQEVTLKDRDVDLGAVVLQSGNVILKEVRIESTVPIAQQKGDTTEFNANSVKVLRDASSEDLVAKLPGVTQENGAIKAQGENITQVLVDGKPFFGNDPTAALRNLPAEVIDKVQIFDQQSDQAQFTGFQDGNTTKTINIVTKKGMNNGQFGKVYTGYGYDDKYQFGGNINVFDGNRRLSFIGMSNNINVQNFSFDDILGVMGAPGGSSRFRGAMMMGGRMPGGGGRGGSGGGGAGDFLVRPQGGIATTHALGINYSDKWGKKTDLNAGYFFNKSVSNAESAVFRQFTAGAAASQVYDENSLTRNDNMNHRFNARINIELDSFNSLLIRPRLTAQISDGNSATQGQTLRSSNLLSETDNRYSSELTGINFSNSLLWRHKFQRKGRTFSTDITTGYSPKDGSSLLQSLNNYLIGPAAISDSLDQQATLDVNNWNVSGNLEYTEPITEKSQLLLNYRAGYQQEASDRYTYDFFAPDDGYTQLNEPLTNVFSNDYITHQAGAGYNYSKDRTMNFNVRLNAQWASLTNDKTFPVATTFGQNFFNWLPSASFRYDLDKSHNVRFNYRTNTQLPSVEQLQDVVNNSNPLQLTIGNPNLRQSMQHNFFMRYQGSNQEKGSTFFAMAGGGLTNDFIANSIYLAGSDFPIFSEYEVQRGAQISRPVNLDGAYSLRSFVSYGRPIKGLKTNINLDGSYNFSRNPGMLNEEKNLATTNSFGAGVTLSSNISERIDFSVSTRPNFNQVRNTLQTNANNDYLTLNSRARLNWIIIEGFVLRTDISHQLFSGLAGDFNQNYWLWNLAVGKKIFKNERGEIALALNDVLNQNRNIQRTVTETYIEDQQTNALRQFVMLSFTYDLRHFNTGKPRKETPMPFGPGGFMPMGF